MSKFTPGPWTCDIRVGCIAVYVGEETGGCIENGRRRLAYFAGRSIKNPDGNFDHWETDPADEADAHLIAAAPDMYEALNDLLDCISETRGRDAYDAQMKALAALAKAEGK